MNPNAVIYLYRAVVMLIAIPFHEAAHALVSWKLGDSTAKDYGRLTLNPAAHFDVMGAICMVAVGVGWAKPVPTDVRRFQNPKAGMALTALAGPVANLLLAYVSYAVFKVIYYFAPVAQVSEIMLTFLNYMVLLNVGLAVFNLIPVPPLDGSRLVWTFLPQQLYFGIMKYERYIMLVLLALLLLGGLDMPLYYARQAVLYGMDWATRYVDILARMLGAAA